jgi:hypothetical protein
MNQKRRMLTVSLVVLIHAILLSQPAHASHLRWMLVKPPVGSTDAHMNQGWHSPGDGVDWDDQDGTPPNGTCCGTGRDVYINSWLYRDSATSQTILYAQYLQSNTADCVRFRVRLKEYTDQTRIIGYLHHRHTNDIGASSHGCAGYSGGQLCRKKVALMQPNGGQEEWEDCVSTGAHTHAEHASTSWGTWTRFVGPPPGAIPTGAAEWTYHNISSSSAVNERRLDWCNPGGIC